MGRPHPALTISAGSLKLLEVAAENLREGGDFVMVEVQPKIEGKTRASTYKNLDTLVNKKLVEKRERDWEGFHYVITKLGRETLAAASLQRRMARWEHLGGPGSYFKTEAEADEWLPFYEGDRDDDMDADYKMAQAPDRFREWELWRERHDYMEQLKNELREAS